MHTNKFFSFNKLGLLIFPALFFWGAYSLWQLWPSLVISSIRWQGEINNQLSELLYLAKENLFEAGFSLAALSFIYGILHSAGPGHGKIIVTTYLATHPTKVKVSLLLSALASLMQAVVAVLLVSVLLLVYQSSMREINHKAELLISFSFIALILLGLFISYRALKQILLFNKNSKSPGDRQTVTVSTLKAIKPEDKVSVHQPGKTGYIKAISTKEQDSCGCGHKHLAAPSKINQASSLREYAAVIFSIGIRPCTGAIMVLLFANMLDIYWLGIISAFIMAVGTAITISSIALLTISGKHLIRRYLRSHTAAFKLSLFSLLLQLSGGSALFLLGLLLINSQTLSLSPVL
ncbi:nickel/cobalt transporter [Psychromonas aquimarina]|uniref:nickel/cobalt transporter n=1 Tax=Psychromonas aquimarina TaxID=444919 RepID=UPI0004205522|nr:nickel/cobalt transporter [Psychromonas aquimarina]